MRPLLGLPIVLLLLATPAMADNPEHDLPGQGEDPVETPAQESITPNLGEIPDVPDLTAGDRAPDFKVRDSAGRLTRLSDLKGHLSALIFGEDCKLLEPYAAEKDSLDALGVRPYGICQNSARTIEKFAKRERLDFPLLSDPNADLAERFGLYDPDGQTIQPGLILLDEKGVIFLIARGSGLAPNAVPELVRRAIAAHLAETAGS
ncbi:MAG TPA: peroxiredoxin family protein [Candidatus Eisenbacteria bacterium]|nr:peroxiredoxin family protein [Candidatus Eisenbacteria bacterium]